MNWPTHGHERTRGMFATLTRQREVVRVELRPTYFPGQLQTRAAMTMLVKAAFAKLYVCGDFHPDRTVPQYCEGCKQLKGVHKDADN